MSFRYFSSYSGRKLTLICAGTTTVALFLVNYVPHTFGLERYKKFMQSYRNGEPIILSEKLLGRLNEACKMLDYNSMENKSLNPFSVYGFDLFSAGSTKSKFGAIIGVPFNYEVDNVEDIKRYDVCYHGEQINWNSECGKLLGEALILSDNEQLFGFCKMILQIQSHNFLMNSLFPSVSFLMVYTIGHYLNQSLNLLQRPQILRLFMYTILGFFGYGSYCFMKDYNQVSSDIDIDERLASISPQMVKAGIGFFEKQLKKNIALKEIGKNNKFTAKGNVNYFLRQKSLPLTARKAFYKKKYQEFLKNTNV